MKVKDLIKELQKVDPEAEIAYQDAKQDRRGFVQRVWFDDEWNDGLMDEGEPRFVVEVRTCC